jgi:hypothetical protein
MDLARPMRSCLHDDGREGNAGLKGMADRFDQPDVEDMLDYIEDRASLLNKVFTDHVIWEQSLEAFGRAASLAATWIDHQGEEHVFAINRVYLDAHFKIVRSLLADLAACGPAGNIAIQSIVALHAEMLGEDDTS